MNTNQLLEAYERNQEWAVTDGRLNLTYTIDCEAGEFEFKYYGPHDETVISLSLNGKAYWYEPGDSYLYSAPEGGTSHSLGEVFRYGVAG